MATSGAGIVPSALTLPISEYRLPLHPSRPPSPPSAHCQMNIDLLDQTERDLFNYVLFTTKYMTEASRNSDLTMLQVFSPASTQRFTQFSYK